MKCLILAAGYATRLYPLTENFPKPLLEVQGRTILDWLIEDMDTYGVIDEYVVISNHRFVSHFERWAEQKKQRITVLDDGTESNETRLGAVKDVEFAVETLNIDDEIMVIAGDNLLDFSITEFIGYARQKQTTCIMRYYEESVQKLRKSGVVTVDEYDRVIKMVEKPEYPETHWCSPAFYYYNSEDMKLIKKGIESGCGTDAPGSFVAWLCGETVVHAMEMPGKRYDIGTIESYEAVQKEYRGII